MSSPLGMIPEQVWDSEPIARFDLKLGKPSGSAMPLVWAHGEFIKLCYSPDPRPARRSTRGHMGSIWRASAPQIDYTIWGPNMRPRRMLAGHTLTIALKAPAWVHWGVNSWQDVRDVETRDTGLKVYVV